MLKETSASPPFFSIIVLNWNGERYLTRCLDAITSQTYQDFEVILLDNASTDHSIEGIETRWPEIRVMRFMENLGFSRANNIGARHASGEWLAILNNDAFPEPNWLEQFAEAVKENPQAAFFSSLLLNADQPQRVQGSGDIYNISGFAWSRDNNTDLEQSVLSQGEIFSPSAAAAIYRRDVFLQVGGFDETFGSHLEDVDLGFRLRLQGYRCWYVPQAVVLHIGSASYGRESNRTVYQVQRNVIWAYVKNMPSPLFWKYLPAHIFANFVFLAYYSFRGQTAVVWKAKWDAVRALPKIWIKRADIQSNRVASSELISSMLDHHWLAPFTLGKTSHRLRSLSKKSSAGKGVA